MELKKLTIKKLVNHEKYKGVILTLKGKRLATSIIRKHRLWETFLVDKLGFNWEEVHDVAEQLEHIRSDKLVSLLDNFLEFPQFDPHGDPIPNSKGQFPKSNSTPLHKLSKGEEGRVMGVLQDNPRKPLKYWIPMCAPTYQNFAQKFLRNAHFSSFSS